MIQRILYVIVYSFLLLPAIAQNTITGYVFNDVNKNNKKDRNEKGLPNVSVSNGRDVVLTNAEGKYSIIVDNDNIVFVIKPKDYSFPVDAYNSPRFFHYHKPLGSPATLKYTGVAATGAIPKSVDFPMLAANETNTFSVLVFGDPQPYNMTELNYFNESIVKDVKDAGKYSFGISLGDLVGDDLDLHEPYKKYIASIGLPWYHVMGNHDMNFDVTADSLSDESFEKNFGPNNYAWNYGSAHFVILDNIIYPDPRDGKGYQGGFRKDQLDFLENNLKNVDKSKLVVISYHIPLDNAEGGGNHFIDADRQRFFSILKDFPNVLLMSAHTHFQEQLYYTQKHGWQGSKPLHEYNAGTTSGDWYSGKIGDKGYPDGTMRDGTPRGYAYLNINNNQYDIQYQVMGAPADYQIEIYAPKVIAKDKRTSALIYANFFMGHKDDVVEFRIDDGNWRKMSYTESIDPNYFKSLIDWDFSETVISGRRPSTPVMSKHLWSASVPFKLNAGTHTIEVRATDKYGKQHTAKKTYNVVAN